MKELEAAIRLRNEEKLKKSNRILIGLTKEHSDNPMVNYQCA